MYSFYKAQLTTNQIYSTIIGRQVYKVGILHTQKYKIGIDNK